MFNLAGRSRALNAATQMSLHATNPGIGASPAAGELTDAPYSRKACVFNAPVTNGPNTESLLNANVQFDLHLSNNQNAQFIGLWDGATYLGYIVPNTPFNFTGTATVRTFTVSASTTKLVRANAA